jgi:Flp pilus assembly protein TadD
VDAEFDRAYALHAAGRDEEALAMLRALVEQHPESAEAHLLLAPMLVTLGRYEEAAAHARLAAERAWNDPYALVRAATTAWHGDPAAAKVYLSRVDELTGWADRFALQTEVWHLKGLLAWGDGEREAAIDWLAQAFAADPAGLGVGADLALALGGLGREADAAAVLEQALEARPGDARLTGLRSELP